MRKRKITLLLLCISILPTFLQGQSMQKALSPNELTLDSLFAIAESENARGDRNGQSARR